MGICKRGGPTMENRNEEEGGNCERFWLAASLTLIATINCSVPVWTPPCSISSTVRCYLVLNMRSAHAHTLTDTLRRFLHTMLHTMCTATNIQWRRTAYLHANACTGTRNQCAGSSLTQRFSLTSQTCLKRQTDSSEQGKQPVGSLI